MGKSRKVIILLFMTTYLIGCGNQNAKENTELEIPTKEMTADSEAEGEETCEQADFVNEIRESIPILQYCEDDLEVYTLGDIDDNMEMVQYTDVWEEEDYKWGISNEKYLCYGDYICYRMLQHGEKNWYKTSDYYEYEKCGGDEILRMEGLHHDTRYGYNFYEANWGEDFRTFVCRRYLNDCSKSDWFQEQGDALICIYKDIHTEKEVQIIFNQEKFGQFVMLEDGFCYSVLPEKEEGRERNWIELWQYSWNERRAFLLKRLENVLYTKANVYANKAQDTAVVLQDIHIHKDEYGREKDILEKCVIFTSWDNFETGVELTGIEAQYNDGSFPYMTENRLLFCNQENILEVDRNGQVQHYLWDESGAGKAPRTKFSIIEGVPFFLIYDRADKPCDAGMIIVDLYGHRKRTDIIPTIVKGETEYGLKSVNIENGIMYGFFLNEYGDRGIVTALDIPISDFAVE